MMQDWYPMFEEKSREVERLEAELKRLRQDLADLRWAMGSVEFEKMRLQGRYDRAGQR